MQKFITFFITDPLFKGKIPFMPFWKKILLFLSLVPIVGIFFFPVDYRNLGEMSWQLLLLILLIRPLGEIFIDFKIFRGLMPLRKELGILCGSLGIAHGIGYFLDQKISLPQGFFDPQIWDISQHYFWGMIGFLIAIILTLTSNIFSIRFLKKNWKKLHKLTYIFFGVVAVHIVLIKSVQEGTFAAFEVWKPALPFFFLVSLWTLSAFKIRVSFAKFFHR